MNGLGVLEVRASWPPNGLELSCPAEAGNSQLLYGTPAGQASTPEGPARRVSFSELLGAAHSGVKELVRQGES
jgi:hypothetical protein